MPQNDEITLNKPELTYKFSSILELKGDQTLFKCLRLYINKRFVSLNDSHEK